MRRLEEIRMFRSLDYGAKKTRILALINAAVPRALRDRAALMLSSRAPARSISRSQSDPANRCAMLHQRRQPIIFREVLRFAQDDRKSYARKICGVQRIFNL